MSDAKRDAVEPVVRGGRRRALAIAFGVVAAVLVLEGGLRIHRGVTGSPLLDSSRRRAREALEKGIWEASADPELVYVHRPDATLKGHRLTNEHGILSADAVSVEKPPDTFRVVLLGDSIGAGLPLYPTTNRFASVLERRLLIRNPAGAQRAEVLNFCVDGYDTLQEARLLETTAGRFDPDVLVLQYCMNDPGESKTPRAWFTAGEAPASEALALLSRLGTLLSGEPTDDEIVPMGGPDGPARERWDAIYDPQCPGWAKVLSGLDRIRAWAEAHEVPVFVALFPLLLVDDPQGTSSERYRSQVVAACEARGFHVVSLHEAFQAAGVRSLTMHPGDIFHPNAKGHRITARVLQERLLAELGR